MFIISIFERVYCPCFFDAAGYTVPFVTTSDTEEVVSNLKSSTRFDNVERMTSLSRNMCGTCSCHVEPCTWVDILLPV